MGAAIAVRFVVIRRLLRCLLPLHDAHEAINDAKPPQQPPPEDPSSDSKEARDSDAHDTERVERLPPGPRDGRADDAGEEGQRSSRDPAPAHHRMPHLRAREEGDLAARHGRTEHAVRLTVACEADAPLDEALHDVLRVHERAQRGVSVERFCNRFRSLALVDRVVAQIKILELHARSERGRYLCRPRRPQRVSAQHEMLQVRAVLQRGE
mmetsp:Transcript_56629/g.115953  ORF Transcript_56629/g.115953 Transcript_56629/m.115953 type:complete len:210 (+) Transcript_56629:2414-3043(+)